MVHAADRIYISNKGGTTFVLEPDAKSLKILAENPLGEQIEASPAFADGQIFIRTFQNLYCIEQK